jgi:hypothetical protein
VSTVNDEAFKWYGPLIGNLHKEHVTFSVALLVDDWERPRDGG